MPNVHGVDINFGVEFRIKLTAVPVNGDGPEIEADTFVSVNELATEEQVNKSVHEFLQLARDQLQMDYRLKTAKDLSNQFGVVVPIHDWDAGPEPGATLIFNDDDADSCKIGGTSSSYDD